MLRLSPLFIKDFTTLQITDKEITDMLCRVPRIRYIVGVCLLLLSTLLINSMNAKTEQNTKDEALIIPQPLQDICIIPKHDDYQNEIHGAEFPKYPSRPEYLCAMPDRCNIPEEALGGGGFYGPIWIDTIKDKEQKGYIAAPLRLWSEYCYFIYPTAESAQENWKKEFLLPDFTIKEGSYTGVKIGDTCVRCEYEKHLFTREYYLHLTRANVSIFIHGYFGNEKDLVNVQAILEYWAQTMVKRIDTIAAKGPIDMSNLPPIHGEWKKALASKRQ